MGGSNICKLYAGNGVGGVNVAGGRWSLLSLQAWCCIFAAAAITAILLLWLPTAAGQLSSWMSGQKLGFHLILLCSTALYAYADAPRPPKTSTKGSASSRDTTIRGCNMTMICHLMAEMVRTTRKRCNSDAAPAVGVHRAELQRALQKGYETPAQGSNYSVDRATMY
jgi:hypothetical protein